MEVVRLKSEHVSIGERPASAESSRTRLCVSGYGDVCYFNQWVKAACRKKVEWRYREKFSTTFSLQSEWIRVQINHRRRRDIPKIPCINSGAVRMFYGARMRFKQFNMRISVTFAWNSQNHTRARSREFGRVDDSVDAADEAVGRPVCIQKQPEKSI